MISTPEASMTRPNDNNAYQSGDLVANSTSAGSVVAIAIATPRAGRSFVLKRVRMRKSGTVATNASFRVHLFKAAPALVNFGDNGVFSPQGAADYLGSADVTLAISMGDGCVGHAVPTGGDIFCGNATAVYALIEARAAYSPVASEVLSVQVELVTS